MAPRRVVEVETGRVRTAAGDVGLRCSALGSCVAVTAYDPSVKAGGIAHVMLPGRPDTRSHRCNRYAVPAVRALLRAMRARGADHGRLAVCLVGGGNVLKKRDETLCRDIVESVAGALATAGLMPVRRAVGGTSRRSVLLETETGSVRITVGDGGAHFLYRATKDPTTPERANEL